jgi:hypothetical protein
MSKNDARPISECRKHDPSAAPFFLGFRQTENAVVVKLGMGMWESIDFDRF